jgi:hypothetical protein
MMQMQLQPQMQMQQPRYYQQPPQQPPHMQGRQPVQYVASPRPVSGVMSPQQQQPQYLAAAGPLPGSAAAIRLPPPMDMSALFPATLVAGPQGFGLSIRGG